MSRVIALGRLALAVPLGIIALGAVSVANPSAQQGGPAEQSQAPRISQAQINRADALASSHQFTRELLSGNDYTVVADGPWHAVNSDEVLGVARLIRFAQPLSFGQRRWPQIQYNTRDDTYRPFSAEFAVQGLQEVSLLVDLRSDRVVAVNPEIYADIVTGDVSEVPESPQKGES